MKKILSLTLTVLMLASAFAFSASAADNKLVWSEDFSKVTTFEQLNWPKNTVFTVNNSVYTIENGRLLIDNATGDTYVEMVPESIMKNVVKDDYTVQYTLEYVSAGNSQRYLAVLLNYDPVMGNSYNSLHIRMRGNGNWQNRFIGTWTHMEATGNTGALAMTNTDDKTMCTLVFGIPYADVTTTLVGKEMVVRQEVHVSKKKVDIYVNNVLVTTTTEAGWDYFELCKDYSIIALKAGGAIKAYIDDISVATGIGIPTSAATTTAPSTTVAPTTTATPGTTAGGSTTPPTSDGTVALYAAAIMLAAVCAAVVIKRKASVK